MVLGGDQTAELSTRLEISRRQKGENHIGNATATRWTDAAPPHPPNLVRRRRTERRQRPASQGRSKLHGSDCLSELLLFQSLWKSPRRARELAVERRSPGDVEKGSPAAGRNAFPIAAVCRRSVPRT